MGFATSKYVPNTGTWTVTLEGEHSGKHYVYKVPGKGCRFPNQAEIKAYGMHGQLVRDPESTVNEHASPWVVGQAMWSAS